MLFSRLIFIFLLSISPITIALAECANKNCNGKIDSLSIFKHGVLIDMSGDESKLECTPKGGTYIQLVNEGSDKHDAYDEVYSLLLGARLAGQPVNVEVHKQKDKPCIVYKATL